MYTHTATGISDLNISSTRLVSQLVPLHDRARALSEQLSQLHGEVMGRREERERQAAREMADTQTQMLKLKRELDVRIKLLFSAQFLNQQLAVHIA